ncbi:putative reverse transcriptase domain-containing protein [Tanacetum coccineum]|uniref:Reverse transcriptase domain-containing protein n=1 Tax=Tanacetum coccineum TaxID=301880 RepID=A0ABQ4X8K5_9ASTR
MKRFMLLKWDVSNVKDPATPKTVYSKKKEIRASNNAAIKNQGALIQTLEIQIWQMRKVLHEREFGSLPSSTKTNPRDHVKSILTTVVTDMTPIRRIGSSQYVVSAQQNNYNAWTPTLMELHVLMTPYLERRKTQEVSLYLAILIVFALKISSLTMPLPTYLNLGLGELTHTKLTVEFANRIVKHPKRIAENVLVGICKFIFPIDFIILDMPEDVKVPLILGRPYLSTFHAKIDVFKRKITLRVGDEKIIFKSEKPASSLIKRVCMLSLRERMELDLEARLMGETLVFNRSLDPLCGDYVKLNDLKVPLEIKRDQVDDLMPTIKEGEWKIWMATKIKIWDVSFLENHSARLHVWKQEGLSIWRILDFAGKEIDNVGEVSNIWNSMCLVVMLGQPEGQPLIQNSQDLVPHVDTPPDNGTRGSSAQLSPRCQVQILQKSQENDQNRTNKDTRTDRVHKSRGFDCKKGQKVNPWSTMVNKSTLGKWQLTAWLSNSSTKVQAGRVRHHKRLLLVEAHKKGHAANGKKHTNDWIFALKLVQKKHRGLTHGMPCWQSVCSLNQSNGHKDGSNDGQRIKVRDYKERVTDSRPRSFISAL